MAKLFSNDTIKPLHDKAYELSLKQEHEGNDKWGSSTKKYGSGDILGLVTHRKYVQTVLDYGCGKGELKKYLKEHAPWVEVSEYDPGIVGKDTPPEGKFDLVWTCDVLEHIQPEYIDDTIVRLFELTKYVMYNNIACASSRSVFKDGPFKGQDLHLIIEEPAKWRERFNRVITDPKCSLMEYRGIERRHKTGWRGRCVMIHERGG